MMTLLRERKKKKKQIKAEQSERKRSRNKNRGEKTITNKHNKSRLGADLALNTGAMVAVPLPALRVCWPSSYCSHVCALGHSRPAAN